MALIQTRTGSGHMGTIKRYGVWFDTAKQIYMKYEHSPFSTSELVADGIFKIPQDIRQFKHRGIVRVYSKSTPKRRYDLWQIDPVYGHDYWFPSFLGTE